MVAKALVIKPNDNVGSALTELKKDELVTVDLSGDVKSIRLREDVPFGFKFALRDIKAGEPIIKYGLPIGLASVDIQPGVVVHVHNCEGARGRGDLD